MSPVEITPLVVALFYGLCLGVFAVVMDKATTISAMEGESVPLNTTVTKQNDMVIWYFEDTLIAQINGWPNNSCVYDGEGGIFKGRLQVDYETGSLTITDIRHEHAGRYEAELIRRGTSGESLNRKPKCDSTKLHRKNIKLGEFIKKFNVTITVVESKHSSIRGSGLSSNAIMGISVAVAAVVVIVAVVICYHKGLLQKTERGSPQLPQD